MAPSFFSVDEPALDEQRVRQRERLRERLRPPASCPLPPGYFQAIIAARSLDSATRPVGPVGPVGPTTLLGPVRRWFQRLSSLVGGR